MAKRSPLIDQNSRVSGEFHKHEIIYHRPAELKPDPRNPRVHSSRQIKQISASIQEFGFASPILLDRNLNVIAGHGRLLAAQRLGMTLVPTICLEHLTSAQAKAYRIADNRLTENSNWNDQLLAETLKELSEIDLDFSVEITGFDMGEIDMRIEALETTKPAAIDPADNLPALGPPVSRRGDLWLLGGHRLFCGDAREAEAFQAATGGKKATIVVTDPPYNVRIPRNVSGLGAVKHIDFAMGSGEMTESEFSEFLLTVFCHLADVCADGAVLYIFMDWRHQAEIFSAGKKAFTKLLNLCVWVKNNAGMGSFYRSQHELVYVFKKGQRPHRNNVELGKHGRSRSNVWSYPGVTSFGRSGEEGNLLALHPTVKPVRMLSDAILDCSRRGDIVVDPFLGSGSTVLAAERTGRVCYGLEIDPRFCDVIIRRWQAFTRRDAVNAATGKSFDDTQEISRATERPDGIPTNHGSVAGEKR